MKTFVFLACLLLTGCHSFPPIKASEIHTSTSYLVVGTSFDATGINVTPTNAKAADVSWKWWFPGFMHTATAKDVVIPQKKAP